MYREVMPQMVTTAPQPRRFVVTLHDVSPTAAAAVQRQLDVLQPLLGATIAAAVIPAAAGPGWNTCPTLLADLAPLERLLHGWRHRRDAGGDPASVLCGRVDEFAGLARQEAAQRLHDGQCALADLFGRPATGFLPPAWRRGAVDDELLAAAGLDFRVGFLRARHRNGTAVKLATETWDFGPAACWGYAGTPVGHLLRRRPAAVPVLALHPCDEQRGFLPRAQRAVAQLLDAGYAPVTFVHLLEPPP
jgi:hypothetical protein